ncbi:MAG: zinc-binding dehydrogenase [Gemmatimonadota bacterium]|nr:MAG: zinc-binding dehydrogenase [Gemmatimonadota bacterium]
MKGVTFRISVPRYAVARTLGRLSQSFLTGGMSGLRFEDVEAPALPGPDWVKLDVIACGVCGSDLSTLRYGGSPAMEPFSSFPSVLGHEILGRVSEIGTRVTRVTPGQRVVVDPMISCTTRGFSVEASCAACLAGRHSTCARAGEDGLTEVAGRPLSPGLTIGYHRDLPGGWGEQVIAHESQVFGVPDELSDNAAVLTEPLAVALHSVLGNSPSKDDSVFVIGSGAIALGTIWALRATGFRGPVTAQVRRRPAMDLALALGATRVVGPGPEARQTLIDTGASAYLPPIGPEVFLGGGFALVFDCVGNPASLDQAFRYTASRGRVVLEGCASHARDLDLTFLWARELAVHGSLGYGREQWQGSARHTFSLVHDFLADTQALVEKIVTHVFPLREYRDAIRAAGRHARSSAIRVVLRPGD